MYELRFSKLRISVPMKSPVKKQWCWEQSAGEMSENVSFGVGISPFSLRRNNRAIKIRPHGGLYTLPGIYYGVHYELVGLTSSSSVTQ